MARTVAFIVVALGFLAVPVRAADGRPQETQRIEVISPGAQQRIESIQPAGAQQQVEAMEPAGEQQVVDGPPEPPGALGKFGRSVVIVLALGVSLAISAATVMFV